MKAMEQNSKRHTILGNAVTNGGTFATWFASWRQKLSYFSVFAALPAIFASHATEARADEVKRPKPSVAGQTARFTEKLNRGGGKPDFLKSQSQYRLPHQKGSFDILSLLGGNDNCPGRTIPAGTYTAAAPYTDTGDTRGANNTISEFYCYYCYGIVPGPDQVYTFRVDAIGPNPQIQVTATSAGYDPAIYLLYDYGGCPAGTNNFGYYALYWLYSPAPGGTETIQFQPDTYFLGVPLHLFVDSAVTGANASGGYTIQIQDVTISPVVLLAKPKVDFDGDGRADVSLFRPSDRTWYLNRSLQGFSALPYGLSTDKITPIYLSGDRRTDIAVFRDGTWWLLYNLYDQYYDGPMVQFGQPNDIPVPADYNGDGYDELAVYRNGTWLMRDAFNDQINTVQFGLAGDKPVPADYDGDGLVDQAVFRGNGEWHLSRSTLGYTVIPFGLATDKPVVGDYDGDTKTDIAVYRDGVWYVLQSRDGLAIFQFGTAGDLPVPDDYDGDGKTDAAIYRNGQWWLRRSAAGLAIQQFGLAGDKPLQSAYLP